MQYGLFDIRAINTYREEFNAYLNHKFYELYIGKLQDEIAFIEKWLDSNNEESNLKLFVETSKKIFNAILFKSMKSWRVNCLRQKIIVIGLITLLNTFL